MHTTGLRIQCVGVPDEMGFKSFCFLGEAWIKYFYKLSTKEVNRNNDQHSGDIQFNWQKKKGAYWIKTK